MTVGSLSLLIKAEVRSCVRALVHRRAVWTDWAALGFFIAVVVGVGAFHEAWFDEAQAWLIARDGTPWEIVSRYARYEGSPPLWHLLLWAVQHLGLPYRAIWLVSATLAAIGAALVLLRSPFPPWVRWGAAFSYYPAYQYGVVARSYALDAALIPALAALYARRLDRPLLFGLLIGLLANCNTHSFLLAAVLGADLAWAAVRSGGWRRAGLQGGVLLAGLLAASAARSAWPPSDVNFETHHLSVTSFVRALMLATEPFIDRLDVWSLGSPDVWSRLGALVLTPMLIVPCVVLFTRAGAGWLFLVGVGALVAFTAAKYGQPWHMGVIFLFWVFALWVSWDRFPTLGMTDRRTLIGALAAILSVQVWDGAVAAVRDLREVYAPGRPVAAALEQARAQNPKTTVGAIGAKAFVVQPWSDRNVFDNFRGPTPGASFYDWRLKQPYVRDPKPAAWRALLAQGYDIAILSSLETIDTEELPAYWRAAATFGYCGEAFDGDMIWKTYIRETQSLILFRRCAAAPPLRPALAE